MKMKAPAPVPADRGLVKLILFCIITFVSTLFQISVVSANMSYDF